MTTKTLKYRRVVMFLRSVTARAMCAMLVFGVLSTSCSSPPPTPSATPTASTQALWGDMTPVVSVKELMHNLLDPLADNIFDAVRTTITKQGTVEKMPRTDAEWDDVRIGAVALAEGAYLLKVRRPFAPPGEPDNSAGPDASEISPAEMTAKVERDPVEWNARIQALRNVGLEVLEIVKKKDADALWAAGEDLDNACEQCHRSYWYPKEDAAFYGRLRDRLSEHIKRSGVVTKPTR